MNPALKWMPLVVSIALVATGCARDGYYHDRNIDYVDAEPSAPLVLPESRDMARYGNAMPVPEASGDFVPSDEGFSAPRPDEVARSRLRDYVERRDIGEDSWLVVNAQPNTIWPQLEDFARRQGLNVTASDPSRGILETQQARLSVRPGLLRGSSVVRCEQAGRAYADCLSSLSNYLGGQSQTASTASALASQRMANEPERVYLDRHNDEWLLVLGVGPELAWAELGYQLESNFNQGNRELLLESDAASRDFLVEYLPRDERERGFFSGFFGPDAEKMTRRLRLVLVPSGSDRTLVRVSNEGERELSSDDTREFLERVASLLR
ncbi:hypothetical protein GCM10007160_39990 [Litchfieldella qijiaojingensis]|uniref:Outer membrane protein assembly factor BamC n=1 Tax=Litchfieldella qijiaojingensis TaxID=980347 RepID=A0ABQ2ZBP6_9GAMM|nr:lipoprotein, NlpB [Halomonas qijiaojingensis]GGY08626.1 hypothetical protein GCM10007160_39990 [Halomonas qijiaojingensis]